MVVVARPLRGSRISSFYSPIPPEGPELSDIDSPFQLQEFISLLIRQNPHDVEKIVSVPGRVKSPGAGSSKDDEEKEKETEGQGEQLQDQEKDARGESTVDEACWIYEQLRRLAQDLTHPLITSLQQECTRTSCPEMKAGEWLYLCVAHGNDGGMEQCCAIDYIIHTLDSATAFLNSPRAFPSRISIPQPSTRHFSPLARRLGRIFAHAYFHHREVFESSEAENSLYARFLTLTLRFDLVPPDFLVVPLRMALSDFASSSSSSSSSSSNASGASEAEPPRLLGAALNPEPGPGSPAGRAGGFGLVGSESPRRVGRNRTDTMVFSEAEAYSEALRGQTGSPFQDPASRSGDLGLGGLPRAESPEIGSEPHVSNSLPESTTRVETEAETGTEAEHESTDEQGVKGKDDTESKPYTLTFSASGTMKTALPPGVSPSNSSSSSGSGITPAGLRTTEGNPDVGEESGMNKTTPLVGNDFAERVPASELDIEDSVEIESEETDGDGEVEVEGGGEGRARGGGDEESALDAVLAQEDIEDVGGSGERERGGDVSLIDLLARKQVLEMREKEKESRLGGDGDEEEDGPVEQHEQDTEEKSSGSEPAAPTVKVDVPSESVAPEAAVPDDKPGDSGASKAVKSDANLSLDEKPPTGKASASDEGEKLADEKKELDPDTSVELDKDLAHVD